MRRTILPPPNVMDPLSEHIRPTATSLLQFLLTLGNAKIFNEFSNMALTLARHTKNMAHTTYDYLEAATLFWEAHQNPTYYYELGAYYEKHNIPDSAIWAYGRVPPPTETDIDDSETLYDANIKDISELDERFYVLTKAQRKQLPLVIKVYVETLRRLAMVYCHHGSKLEKAGEFMPAIAAYQKSRPPTNHELIRCGYSDIKDLYASYKGIPLKIVENWPLPVRVYITARMHIGFCFLQYAKQHLKLDMSKQEVKKMTAWLKAANKYISTTCRSATKILECDITVARMYILNKISAKFMQGFTIIVEYKNLFDEYLKKPETNRMSLATRLSMLQRSKRENTSVHDILFIVTGTTNQKINPSAVLNLHINPALHEALLYLCKIRRSASASEKTYESILKNPPPEKSWPNLKERAIDYKSKKDYATAFVFYFATVIKLETTCNVPPVKNRAVYYRALFNCADMLENIATTIGDDTRQQDLLQEAQQFYAQVAEQASCITCSDRDSRKLKDLAAEHCERLSTKTVETLASENQLTL